MNTKEVFKYSSTRQEMGNRKPKTKEDRTLGRQWTRKI